MEIIKCDDNKNCGQYVFIGDKSQRSNKNQKHTVKVADIYIEETNVNKRKSERSLV